MSKQHTAVIGDQNIVNTNIVNVGNTTRIIHVYHAQRGKPLTLESCVAFGALLNAKERYPPPKCHPDTRQAAQAVVKNWICRCGDELEKDIMWMSGAPGVGKSAIAQTVGETLGADDGSMSWLNRMVFGNRHIDGCFFFARGSGEREKAASFPATIAYQLARSRLSFRWSIRNAISAKPSIFEESWPSQFRHLVLKPLTESWTFMGPATIVIDGLDECDSIVDQVELLGLILEATATKKMRCFIASRPEQAIETFFSQIHVSHRTCHIRLDEKTFHTRRDIEVFLRAKFARIRQLKPEGCPRLPNGEDWPGGDVIRQIADDSDSQFMFPELAIDFIDLPGFSPDEQLHILLTAPPPHAFTKLDALYEKILSYRPSSELLRDDDSPVDYREAIVGILQIVIAWPGGPFSPARIAKLLDDKVDVVQSIIHGPMRSLFKSVSADPDSPVTLCHKSLRDYLLDRRRSRDFFISCGDADSFFIRILSRRPPTNPVQMYYPGAVMDVLTALLVKGGRSSVADIATSLCLDFNLVERVIYGPTKSLFDVATKGIWLSTPSLSSFLMDAGRAGTFYIPTESPDALLLRIVTRQSLSNLPCSQDVWMGILSVVLAQPFTLNISVIAFVLGVAPEIVEGALYGPTNSLFKITSDGVSFSTPAFPDFLSDPQRAGLFHVPSSTCDTLFAGILSRQPPSEPSQYYSRDLLLSVLTVVKSWGTKLTVSQIASVLGADPGAVDKVVFGTTRALFERDNTHRIILSNSTFDGFLSDPERAEEFYISSDKRDALFTGILSRQPPTEPSRPYSQDFLFNILTVVKAWEAKLTVSQIAGVLGVNPIEVDRVVSGATHALFEKDHKQRIILANHAFGLFLSDPERAGDFWISTGMLDIHFLRILSLRPPSDPQDFLMDVSQTYSRRTLLDILAVALLTRDENAFDLSPHILAPVINASPQSISYLLNGPASLLFLDNDKNIRIHPHLKELLHDVHRAEEFYIPEEGKVLNLAKSHYGSLYSKFRNMEWRFSVDLITRFGSTSRGLPNLT